MSLTKRSVLAVLGLALAGIVAGGPASAQGTHPELPLLGGAPLGFGVDIASLKSGLGPAPDRLSAISFDLKLQWPMTSSDEASDVLRRLEPFVTLGPALILAPLPADTPPYLDLRAPPDTGLAVGIRGGAGLSLQLGKSTSLFGQYGVTRATSDRVPGVGGRSPLDPNLTAHDVLYGISVRF